MRSRPAPIGLCVIAVLLALHMGGLAVWRVGPNERGIPSIMVEIAE